MLNSEQITSTTITSSYNSDWIIRFTRMLILLRYTAALGKITEFLLDQNSAECSSNTS
jgi:hypothetical protein